MFCHPFNLERSYLRIIRNMKKGKENGLSHPYLSKKRLLLKKYQTFLEKCIDLFI